MSAQLDVGVNADADAGADGIFLSLLGKINVGIQSLVQKQSAADRREQAALERIPMVYPLTQVVQPGAAVFTVADFGGPPAGRQWSVQMLMALASPLGSNASVVTWYVGQNMPGPANGQLPISMARWQFPSIPANEDFSKTILVLPNEHLLAGLTNIPASSTLVLTAIIADMPYPGPVTA